LPAGRGRLGSRTHEIVCLTIIHFVYVLVIATVMLIPVVRRMPLGTLLVIAGLLSFGRSVSDEHSAARQRHPECMGHGGVVCGEDRTAHTIVAKSA
jgi:hypothetical protein